MVKRLGVHDVQFIIQLIIRIQSCTRSMLFKKLAISSSHP